MSSISDITKLIAATAQKAQAENPPATTTVYSNWMPTNPELAGFNANTIPDTSGISKAFSEAATGSTPENMTKTMSTGRPYNYDSFSEDEKYKWLRDNTDMSEEEIHDSLYPDSTAGKFGGSIAPDNVISTTSTQGGSMGSAGASVSPSVVDDNNKPINPPKIEKDIPDIAPGPSSGVSSTPSGTIVAPGTTEKDKSPSASPAVKEEEKKAVDSGVSTTDDTKRKAQSEAEIQAMGKDLQISSNQIADILSVNTRIGERYGKELIYENKADVEKAKAMGKEYSDKLGEHLKDSQIYKNKYQDELAGIDIDSSKAYKEYADTVGALKTQAQDLSKWQSGLVTSYSDMIGRYKDALKESEDLRKADIARAQNDYGANSAMMAKAAAVGMGGAGMQTGAQQQLMMANAQQQATNAYASAQDRIAATDLQRRTLGMQMVQAASAQQTENAIAGYNIGAGALTAQGNVAQSLYGAALTNAQNKEAMASNVYNTNMADISNRMGVSEAQYNTGMTGVNANMAVNQQAYNTRMGSLEAINNAELYRPQAAMNITNAMQAARMGQQQLNASIDASNAAQAATSQYNSAYLDIMKNGQTTPIGTKIATGLTRGLAGAGSGAMLGATIGAAGGPFGAIGGAIGGAIIGIGSSLFE